MRDEAEWVVITSEGSVVARFSGTEWGRDAALMSLASHPGCHVERREG